MRKRLLHPRSLLPQLLRWLLQGLRLLWVLRQLNRLRRQLLNRCFGAARRCSKSFGSLCYPCAHLCCLLCFNCSRKSCVIRTSLLSFLRPVIWPALLLPQILLQLMVDLELRRLRPGLGWRLGHRLLK